MKSFKLNVLCILFLFNFVGLLESKPIEVGIEDKEKLGKNIPLDLKFTNSDGRVFALRELIDKPTIISLVYFRCPGICSPLLNGLSEVIDQVDLEPGKDFNVLSISIDHLEDTLISTKWKNRHVGELKRKIDSNSWKFMTGDSVSIRELTNSVGFYFKKDGEVDYLHPATLIMISPKGKITRYLFGTSYLPFDIKMATIEATREQDRPTISKILDLCFKYDSKGKKFVFNLLPILGGAMLITIAIFAIYLIFSGKNKRKSKLDQGDTI